MISKYWGKWSFIGSTGSLNMFMFLLSVIRWWRMGLAILPTYDVLNEQMFFMMLSNER